MIPRSLSSLPWSCGLGLSQYPPESRIIEVLERNRCSSMVELSVCSPYAPPSAAFPNVFHVKPPITRLCCRSSVSPPAFGGHTRVAQRMSVAGPRRPLTLSRCPLAADRYSNHFRSWSGVEVGLYVGGRLFSRRPRKVARELECHLLSFWWQYLRDNNYQASSTRGFPYTRVDPNN